MALCVARGRARGSRGTSATFGGCVRRVARGARSQHYPGRHRVPEIGVRPSPDRDLLDVGMLEQRSLDLCGVDLLSTYVDDLGISTQDPDVLAVHLDDISGLEPSVVRKRTGRVQVAQHGGLGLDLEHPIDNTGLEALSSHLHPERIGRL